MEMSIQPAQAGDRELAARSPIFHFSFFIFHFPVSLRRLAALGLLVLVSCSSWNGVADGVRARHVVRGEIDVHVVAIDLRDPDLHVVVSDERFRQTTVREAAEAYDAIVAINGDYFDIDGDHRPVGLSIGQCGRWESMGSARRQWIVGFANGRAEILRPESLDAPVPEWIETAVSGWPILVEGCRALTAEELLGSDGFTRSPHPRTAIGIDREGTTLYLVVADGRRGGVPGLTLAELATFMRDELGACSALNLDGGGSTEMVVDGRIVNVPSDGEERPVGNHVLVMEGAAEVPCGE